MKNTFVLLLALCGFVPFAQAQDLEGNAERGSKINDTCIGCHGIADYKSSFPQVYHVPAIGGQNPKYILAALEAYRKGDRKHPTMRAVAGSLSDQDIADLAAYYGAEYKAAAVPEVPALQPPAAVADLLTRGACASCHGANFAKPIDGSYPKIAGQYPDYLYAALTAYKTVGNPMVGRGNPIMAAQVQQFSSKERRALADYIGSLPGEVATVAQSRFR